jgi:hypothetical protein
MADQTQQHVKYLHLVSTASTIFVDMKNPSHSASDNDGFLKIYKAFRVRGCSNSISVKYSDSYISEVNLKG